jgi:hypothetical protein
VGQPTSRAALVDRRAVRLLTVALLVVPFVAACRPPREGAGDASRQVEVRVLDEPARVGPATIEVDVRRNGERVDGATVRVTGDMTHAGMVSVVSDALPLGAGRYRTDGFTFTMAGDWILTVDVTYPDAVTRQVAVAVAVER